MTARPLRILVAEDNPINQRVALRLLEKHGHTVVLASNGREAVTAALGGGIDLVLMDVEMPVMDGLVATAAIRAAEPEGERRLPILALTALAVDGDRERCLSAGMDGYLTKPIQGDHLLRALAEAVA
jgi:CheY-like chemotaxis protein